MADKAFENKLGDKNQFITFASFVCAIMIVGLHAFNAGGEPLGSVSRFIEAVFSHGLFTLSGRYDVLSWMPPC